MKIKRVFAFILCGILLFGLVACKADYKAKLIYVMSEQETATVQDIFSFEFDRAYIFHLDDCYMNGEVFAQTYNLDIAITQVEDGQADYIQRIVFVDKSGSFMYEFQCRWDEVQFFESEGLIIYPDTVIRKTVCEEEQLVIRFESSDRYDSDAAH